MSNHVLNISLRVVGALVIITSPFTQAKAAQTAEERAQLLIKRLLGTGVPADSPIFLTVAESLRKGEAKAAARYITDRAGINRATGQKVQDYNPNFYNIVVRDFFARMSTREERVTTPLNDFVATGIGIVRDNINAQEFVTGNYIYRGRDNATPTAPNIVNDILLSENHYTALLNAGVDLNDVLIKENQAIANNGASVRHPDPAGLITTRAFLGAHAIAGTNRRPVEYVFREFMCTPIEGLADTASPDSFVGRDVERFPAGDHMQYETTCRSCHGNMDALRPVFGKFDFVTNAQGQNQVTHSDIGGNGAIVAKYARNVNVYPAGFPVNNTAWVNFATTGGNGAKFGWGPGKTSGSTLQEFGQMIAASKGFSRCMVKRVFESVCRRSVIPQDTAFVESMATRFETGKYNMRELFEDVAISNECLGQ